MIVKPLTIKYIRKFKSFFDERLSEEILIKRVKEYYNKLNESLRIVSDEEKYIEEVDAITKNIISQGQRKKQGVVKFKLFQENKITNKEISLRYILNYVNVKESTATCTITHQTASTIYVDLYYFGTSNSVHKEISKQIMVCLVSIFKQKTNYNFNLPNNSSEMKCLSTLIHNTSNDGINRIENNFIMFLKKYNVETEKDKIIRYKKSNNNIIEKRSEYLLQEFYSKNNVYSYEYNKECLKFLTKVKDQTIEIQLFNTAKQYIPNTILSYDELLFYFYDKINELNNNLKNIVISQYE